MNHLPVCHPWMNQSPVCHPWMNQSPVCCPWMNHLPVCHTWMNQSPVCCPWMNQWPVCQWIIQEALVDRACPKLLTLTGLMSIDWTCRHLENVINMQIFISLLLLHHCPILVFGFSQWRLNGLSCEETEWPPAVRRLNVPQLWGDWMISRCAETEWSPGVRRLLTSLCWWVNILTNRKESVSASIALQTWSHLPQEQISVPWTDSLSSAFSLPMVPSFDVFLFF